MSVAEGELALLERVAVGHGKLGGGGQVVDVDEVLVEPVAVGELGGELALDLGVGHDAALHGIHEEHVAGLEAALLHDVGGGDVEHAGLGGQDNEIVLGHVVAGGAEAVAIKHGADDVAVGEGHGGGAVPRLHEARVVLVEGLAGIVHGLVVGPGLGDHHHDRVRQGATGEVQELEGVIEHRRVGAIGVDDGEDLRDVVAEGIRDEVGLAGVHPVDVAA